MRVQRQSKVIITDADNIPVIMPNAIRAFLLILLLFSSLASAQEVGVLHLRPLHLELPATWKFDGTKNPIEGTGPEGEKLLVSIMRRKPDSAATAPPATEMAKYFARDRMAQLSARDGKTVIREVTELTAPDGKLAFSAASEKSGLLSGERYFIQYLLACDSSLFYLTVEGSGKAAPVLERFDQIISRQQWDN